MGIRSSCRLRARSKHSHARPGAIPRARTGCSAGPILCVVLPALLLSACGRAPQSSAAGTSPFAASEGETAMSVKVEVELDIFSGNPNPAWILSDVDGRTFLERV